ncbi:1-phosphofructokinase family hexose kinase [Nonomuraea sp. SBT364]|uniref:1-phosphofructokinase family hexose kinase n=1 Tax=Nonomuraea sp. SBT364 TaxID=1580530 RepID=UPI00066CCC74|nr:hexose kinase [Nonomuraea sp. SBT364]
MIVTVTANPALDITYRVDELRVDSVNRVRAVASRAGGKGLNVARVLRRLGAPGVPVIALGLAGGPCGEVLRADLDTAGIAHDLVRVDAETRRTVTVVDSRTGTVTLISEPGAPVDGRAWAELREQVAARLPAATVLVLSGSLPPGLPADAYAVLTTEARRHGVPVVVDADGQVLQLAVAARPEVVKPNAAELGRATGLPDLADGSAHLRRLGAVAVVASDGPGGLHADTPGGRWRAVPPAAEGNPTGAGDAAVAAIALGLTRGWDWPRTLIHAAALSAAAVSAPLAGDVDLAAYRDNLTRVELHAAQEKEPQCR